MREGCWCCTWCWNAREYLELKEELEALRPLGLSRASVEAALRAQAELAQHAAGFHRRPPQNYFVAAVAATHGVGALHYAGDFDRILRHSSLAFESVWLAPAGTLVQEPPDPLRDDRRVLGLGLAQFSGERTKEVLDRLLDLLQAELLADGLQVPVRP